MILLPFNYISRYSVFCVQLYHKFFNCNLLQVSSAAVSGRNSGAAYTCSYRIHRPANTVSIHYYPNPCQDLYSSPELSNSYISGHANTLIHFILFCSICACSLINSSALTSLMRKSLKTTLYLPSETFHCISTALLSRASTLSP